MTEPRPLPRDRTPPPGHTWIGSTLMTTEQAKIEGWKQDSRGYWRAGTIDQLNEWSVLRRDRKAAKKAAYQRSLEQDDEWAHLYPETQEATR